jgi:hypothetical protein
MAEVTATGFVAKTEQEYYDEGRQLYLDIDPKWNLDPSSPDGLKLAADSETFTNLDEAAQAAYNSKDPNKSRGLDLDILCALTGTFRNLGTPSTVTLNFTGVDGTVIPSDTLFESVVDGTLWSTNSSVTISVGTASVTATCTINGATAADIGTITRIVTTIGGLQTVTNPAVATLGTNKQTDPSLRLERAKAVARPGNNQISSMLGEILSVSGVNQAVIFENDTGSEAIDPIDNPHGLPKYSISPIVDGGLDDDVAFAIYVKKNPGCRLYPAGDEVVITVTDPIYTQQTKTIRFSRPVYIDMVITVDIINDGTLPVDADDLISQAIVDYSRGELVSSECGFNVKGFAIGEDVPVSRINTPINQVIGRYGNSYVTSLTVNGQTTGIIDIDFNQLSRWATGNITVNIT